MLDDLFFIRALIYLFCVRFYLLWTFIFIFKRSFLLYWYWWCHDTWGVNLPQSLVTQVWECTSGKELAWNLLCLFTTSGMLFLEVSLLAFLLQGNNTGDLEALTRSFGISALVVGLDILLKVFLLEVCLWVETLPVCFFFSTHQCSLTCQIKLVRNPSNTLSNTLV